jgi:putative ABC transport system permease protein
MKRSLRSWLWRVPLDQEVDEEIGFHIEMRTRELVEKGLDPRIAREMVLARLGDANQLKRTCVDLGRKRDREMRLTQWLEEFRDDVRFAVRQLKASPGFTLVAAITLALGIGANGAIFALVDAALLRPLPLPDPDRLVVAWEQSDTRSRSGASPMDLLDWNERSRTFEKLAGYIPNVGGMVMAGADGNAETVPRQWVTGGVFDVLGIRPIAGRTFLPADDVLKSGSVVLSEGFWRTRFGGDLAIVGREIKLDGMPFTVVGVVPQEAQLVGSTSIWALIKLRGPIPTRGPRVFRVVGRVKPGITLEAAGSDMTTVAEGLANEFPATNKGWGVRLEPLHEVLIGSELRVTSMFFLGVVGFVLLICCANVANLLLARATVRGRELTIRSALGAGKRRIVRQLLTESLVLAAVGGAMGVGIGAAILSIAPSLIPVGLLPAAVSLTFDGRVAAFCAAAALLVGLLFGLAPAWHLPELALAQATTSETRTATGRGGTVRDLLVVGEVAAAVLLLFGAGLLMRTLLAVDNVDRGYQERRVLTMLVDPLGGRYPTPESKLQFFDTVEREVMGGPGIRSMAWASTLPLGESTFGPSSFEIVGDPPLEETQRPAADYQIVSPSYFATLDLPIVNGRGFSDRDTQGGVQVCIVNEAFVRDHLQGRSPIGVRLAIPSVASGKLTAREIVGVARQVKGQPDEREDLVQIYVPLAQDAVDDIFMVVRPESGPAEAIAPSVRAAIARIDKEQLVSVRGVMTLEDIAWVATARHRFRAVLVMTFAVLALALAMVGVFGVIAYSVQQRVREFGVRIALGATTRQVLALVLGSAARTIGVGAVIGLGAAALTAQSISTFLFGVQPLDPLTFASVAFVLAVTATIAAVVPAMRAAHVDPVEAFRSE